MEAYEVEYSKLKALLDLIHALRNKRNEYTVGSHSYLKYDKQLEIVLTHLEHKFTSSTPILHTKYEAKSPDWTEGPDQRPTLSRYNFDIQLELRRSIPGEANLTLPDVKTPPKL
jgi:hypothetical protein